ncbi:MAG: hypothetical protein SWK76_07035 [Actinomycetota bacterium]|nr:hypothetical protein [Actinomycetota bacterium]
MKKTLVVVIITAMVLGVVAIAGCGGDANKDEAKQFMESGDAKMDTVITKWSGVEEQQAELATAALEGDYSEFTEESATAIADEMESIQGTLDEAYADYLAITGLDGVQDYRDYAGKMMEVIELWKKKVDNVGKLLASLTEAMIAAQGGAEVDLLTLMMESEEYADIQELDEQIDTLTEEAEQIKTDKKLAD